MTECLFLYFFANRNHNIGAAVLGKYANSKYFQSIYFGNIYSSNIYA